MRNLNKELRDVAIHNFIEKFEKSVNKELKKSLRRAIPVVVSSAISIIGYLATENAVFLSVFIVTSSGVLIKTAVDNIKEERIILKNLDNKNKELTLDDVVAKGIDLRLSKDFFNDEYKEDVKKSDTKTETQIKIEEILKAQRSQSTETIRTKEEVISDILYKIDTLYYAYNLPPLTITDKEWDMLFDRLYELSIKNNNDINGYYNDMLKLIRYTFSNALINELKEIDINAFIIGLDYVYPKEVVNNEKAEIIKQTNNLKTVDFNTFKKKLEDKKN